MASEASNGWALILGASSGIGAASGIELARTGWDVFGVHLDRMATQPQVEQVQTAIRAHGRQSVFFNVNAADADKRGEVLNHIDGKLKELGQQGGLKVLVHSLAFGTLKPFVPDDGDAVTQSQLEMTMDVMANSLVYWTQEIMRRKLMGANGRILALTSEGSTTVWRNYGPVSAAKSALESHCRQLAVELAQHQISVNAIRAGVTDTPALRKIPGHEEMIAGALRRNPHKRLTTPEDVAKVIGVLARPESGWLTGNVLGVDGGEHIAG
ncbi:MAG: enoyl-ACP reductase [Myxococcales bacterium]